MSSALVRGVVNTPAIYQRRYAEPVPIFVMNVDTQLEFDAAKRLLPVTQIDVEFGISDGGLVRLRFSQDPEMDFRVEVDLSPVAARTLASRIRDACDAVKRTTPE